jgi:2-oxo-3-hexenedioate decarboxylase
MPISEDDCARIAELILSASDATISIPPITDSNRDFDIADAYRVSAEIVRMRAARGERPIGWKIGFTNTTIWEEYGVYAPIWGPMYDSTTAEISAAGIAGAGPPVCPVRHLVEPRIEPEIALRIAAVPHPDMDEAELFACVDAVTHGFEIVQSIYPGWKFRASDTVAAFAMHGCYRYRPFVTIDPAERAEWLDRLRRFEITLFRDGEKIDRGVASNVMDGGPLAALDYLVRGLAAHAVGFAVGTGDIVTTGTVTRAFPVAPGERWSTRVDGLPLPGVEIALS